MRKLLNGMSLALGLLTASAVNAAVLYTNGAPDGTHNAWFLSGDLVADSFNLTSSSILTGVDFELWTPSDQPTSVDWTILDGEPGVGSVLDSGTASITGVFLFDNSFQDHVYTESFALPNISLASGTYWLELTTNPTGPLVGWDMNGGPSSVWVDGFDHTTCPVSDYPTGRCSDTFDIVGTESGQVPEPITLSLFGAGLAGAVAVRRRKKKAA